jgi:hypothetical protein
MDPGEEWARLLLFQPGQGRIRDFVRGPLDLAQVEVLVFLEVPVMIVLWAGSVRGAAVAACSNRTPRPARASSVGVETP